MFHEITYSIPGEVDRRRESGPGPEKASPGGEPPGLFRTLPSGRKGHEVGPYAPTFSLIQAVVWDFGRVMGSHQARLMMSWERRPMARDTLKKTV